jgi:hypothetical protein
MRENFRLLLCQGKQKGHRERGRGGWGGETLRESIYMYIQRNNKT